MYKLAIVIVMALTPALVSARNPKDQSAPATGQDVAGQSGDRGTYGPPAPLPEPVRAPAASNSTVPTAIGDRTSSHQHRGRRHGGYVGAEGGALVR